MANHFVAALGLPVGDSLLEPEGVPVARQILDRCKERGVALVLPSDFVVAPSLERAGEAKTVAMNAIPAERGGLRHRRKDRRDVPPHDEEREDDLLERARWASSRRSRSTTGTLGVAKILAESAAFTVVGGGESVEAVKEAGLAARSRTSRRAAARRSISSPARRCPEWRLCVETSAAGFVVANWKMFLRAVGGRRAGARDRRPRAAGRRRRGDRAFVPGSRPRPAGAPRKRHRARGPGRLRSSARARTRARCPPRAEGRSASRSASSGHSERRLRSRRARGGLRPQDGAARRGRARAALLRRRDAKGARGRPHARRAPDPAPAPSTDLQHLLPGSRSPTSPSGPSGPGSPPLPRWPRKPTRSSGRSSPPDSASRSPSRRGSSTAAPCLPRAPPGSSRRTSVDGGLVGGASLSASDTAAILAAAAAPRA